MSYRDYVESDEPVEVLPSKHRKAYTRQMKPHCKSRNGCDICKRRKIKCDETRPSCHNCNKFQIVCPFSLIETQRGSTDQGRPGDSSSLAWTSIQDEPTAVPFANHSCMSRSRRGRPRKNWLRILLDAKSPEEKSRVIEEPPPNQDNNVIDLIEFQDGNTFTLDWVTLWQAWTSWSSFSEDAGRNSALDMHTSQAATLGTGISPHLLKPDQVEMLLHFATQTGATLQPNKNANATLFWCRNAPRLALAYPCIMHLLLSVTASHMMESASRDGALHHKLVELKRTAVSHLSAGCSAAADLLLNVNSQTCGAVYVSSLLISYAGLAAGPRGSEDLLVCNSVPGQQSFLSLIRGVRALRRTFKEEDIFSDLMQPLKLMELDMYRPAASQNSDPQPFVAVCMEDKEIIRLDWVPAFERLKDSIQLLSGTDNGDHLLELERVAAIYEAIFGIDSFGTCSVPPENCFVCVWLYRLGDDYIRRIETGDTQSLLVLSYYAVLLKVYPMDWFLHGWTEHILLNVREKIDPAWSELLRWPLEALRRLDGLDNDELLTHD